MGSTYTSLYVHIIFSTKERRKSISKDWRQQLHDYLAGTAKGLGTIPIAIGGTEDHVHLLLSIRGKHCVSDLVRELKKASTNWARQHLANFEWQSGYGAVTLRSAEQGVTAAYIRNQEEHHKSQSSKEELRQFLIENGLEIDERFFE